jgi:hypothetical protein
MIVEPRHKGFFSFLWPDLRFNVRRHCTPGSENEFVDVETFSDDVAEVRKEVTVPVAAITTDAVADPQPSDPKDKASHKFVKELECSLRGVLCRMLLWSRLVKIFLRIKTLLP